jgi:DHA1 family bicyclomycin/chloramphenicol resistance-like MFS transporter
VTTQQSVGPETVPSAKSGKDLGPREFLLLVSVLSATTAIGIDLVLPAFPDIRRAFDMDPASSRVAWMITAYFLGLAFGPWLYGPASDRYGRRKPLYAGLGLYAVAALIGAFAPSWPLVVVARFAWGLGAAGPRALSMAMVRDRYHGDAMARIMSISMAVFLVVPILAPSLGAALIAILPWKVVFWVPAIMAGGLMLWCRRLPETLDHDRRRPLTWSAVTRAGREVLSHRQSIGLIVSMTFIFGIMNAYLAGSEVILSDVYGYGTWFPLFFGCIAVLFAAMSLINARLVGRVGATRLIRREALVGVVTMTLLFVVGLTNGGRPNFWLLSIALALSIPMAQGLVPISNTLAMEPVPHVAGTASSIIGTITFGGGALLGNVITGAFNGTVRPFSMWILGYFAVATAAVLWATHRKVSGSTPV